MRRYYIIIFILFSFLSYSEKNKEKFINVFSKNELKNEITYIYELKNKDAKNLIDVLKIFDNLKIKSFENKLIIKGYKLDIDELIKILVNLDTLKKQVFIKIKILDIKKNLIDRLGINFRKENSTSLIKYLKYHKNKNLKKFFDNEDIKIRIMPSILVLDNNEAKLNISNLSIKLRPLIKYNDKNKYIELDLEINFKNNKKLEYIKTKVNISNYKSICISQNKFLENSSFTYINTKKEYRQVYIEVEVRII